VRTTRTNCLRVPQKHLNTCVPESLSPGRLQELDPNDKAKMRRGKGAGGKGALALRGSPMKNESSVTCRRHDIHLFRTILDV